METKPYREGNWYCSIKGSYVHGCWMCWACRFMIVVAVVGLLALWRH